MKLGFASTAHSSTPRLVAGLDGGKVVDLQALAAERNDDLAASGHLASPKAAIAAGPDTLSRIRELLENLDGAAERTVVAERDLIFLPPVPDPEKFLCVGKNYRAHLDELVRTDLIREIPNEPTGFIKLNSVLVGQDAEVERPRDIVMFDYEPELAFVIGRPAYRVSKQDAMAHVAGITLFNDLTAREIQKREVASGTRFWTAKNMPGFGPIGPYVATLDEVDDVNDVLIGCRVNGSERLRFSTSGQINKIPDIVEHFSRFMPLKPGDIFATGSAAGTAFSQPNAEELFLKPGDLVEIGIEGLMSLRTRIV